MEDTRQFRPGLIAFALAIAISLVAVMITWLTSSAQDFGEVSASWNCRVSREIAVFPVHWYCLPGTLRLSALICWGSCVCFASAWLNSHLANDWLDSPWPVALALRFVLATSMVGMLIFLQFYTAAYVIDRGGPWLIAGSFLAAILVGKAMFPRTNPLLLALPLTVSGFFGFVFHAWMLGLEFDV